MLKYVDIQGDYGSTQWHIFVNFLLMFGIHTFMYMYYCAHNIFASYKSSSSNSIFYFVTCCHLYCSFETDNNPKSQGEEHYSHFIKDHL